MNAIMETLTNNERVIVQVLIAAGGRMTQAEFEAQNRNDKIIAFRDFAIFEESKIDK